MNSLTVSSGMIIESANETLKMASANLNRLASDEFPPNLAEALDEHILRLTEIVASLAIARQGIVSRCPTFNHAEACKSIDKLTKAIEVLTDPDTVGALLV